MELFYSIKRVVLGIFCIVLFYCSILWLSIILYGLIYYLCIPAAAHIRPIYLQIPPVECATEDLEQSMCLFPFGNVTLVNEGENRLLSRGHAYAVELALDMPDSTTNRNIGMFMVQAEMLSQSRSVLQYSSRPAMLSYKSYIYQIIFTLFYTPYLLAGSLEEKQTIVVPLFEEYLEDFYQPTYFSYIRILSKSIQVYSCHLRIHAHFRGLRYYMYYWPVLSAFVGVAMFFFTICLSVLIVLFYWMKTSELMNLPAQINARLQEQKQRRLRREERKRRRMAQQSSEISSSRGGVRDSSGDLTDTEGESSPAESQMLRGQRPSRLAAGETSQRADEGNSPREKEKEQLKGTDSSKRFVDFSHEELEEMLQGEYYMTDEEPQLLQAVRQRRV